MDGNPYARFKLRSLLKELDALEIIVKDNHLPLWFVGLAHVDWGNIDNRRKQLRLAILEKKMGL